VSNRTSLSIVPPEVADEPTAYLNPGTGQPFAVVQLGPGAWLYVHEPEHSRAIAAAFTKAADLLDDAQQHQEHAGPTAPDAAAPTGHSASGSSEHPSGGGS